MTQVLGISLIILWIFFSLLFKLEKKKNTKQIILTFTVLCYLLVNFRMGNFSRKKKTYRHAITQRFHERRSFGVRVLVDHLARALGTSVGDGMVLAVYKLIQNFLLLGHPRRLVDLSYPVAVAIDALRCHIFPISIIFYQYFILF